MEFFETALEFCKGCEGEGKHVNHPIIGEFYFCDRLQVIAQRFYGEWVLFCGMTPDRLLRMIESGKKGLREELYRNRKEGEKDLDNFS